MKFKKGDIVVVVSKKAFKVEGHDGSDAGYGDIGVILTIKTVHERYRCGGLYFFEEMEFGYYGDDLEHAHIHNSPLIRALS